MSTRSYVGIIEDGKVKYGYHHSDSHLESLGVELFQDIKEEYEAYRKISKYSEMDYETASEVTRKQFFEIPNSDIFIEFCYGFDVDNEKWYVSSCHFTDSKKEFDLLEVVKDDKEMKCYGDMYYDDYKESTINYIRENIKEG